MDNQIYIKSGTQGKHIYVKRPEYNVESTLDIYKKFKGMSTDELIAIYDGQIEKYVANHNKDYLDILNGEVIKKLTMDDILVTLWIRTIQNNVTINTNHPKLMQFKENLSSLAFKSKCFQLMSSDWCDLELFLKEVKTAPNYTQWVTEQSMHFDNLNSVEVIKIVESLEKYALSVSHTGCGVLSKDTAAFLPLEVIKRNMDLHCGDIDDEICQINVVGLGNIYIEERELDDTISLLTKFNISHVYYGTVNPAREGIQLSVDKYLINYKRFNINLAAIVATDKNLVIGADNKLLWSIPNEMNHFIKMTRYKTVVMGRKTFLSIGRPLPNRKNIVLTTDDSFFADGITVVHSVDELFNALVDNVMPTLEGDIDVSDVFVIGGGEIYKLLHNYINEYVVSEIDMECDVSGMSNVTYLDDISKDSDFELVTTVPKEDNLCKDEVGFEVKHYVRR